MAIISVIFPSTELDVLCYSCTMMRILVFFLCLVPPSFGSSYMQCEWEAVISQTTQPERIPRTKDTWKAELEFNKTSIRRTNTACEGHGIKPSSLENPPRCITFLKDAQVNGLNTGVRIVLLVFDSEGLTRDGVRRSRTCTLVRFVK